MKFEPETFFIGVIDFFSVMLPGAVMTYLLKDKALCELNRAGFPEIQGESAGWAMFLFCSYLVGHFIFLIGSKLDDWVYQRIRDANKTPAPTSASKNPRAFTIWLNKKLVWWKSNVWRRILNRDANKTSEPTSASKKPWAFTIWLNTKLWAFNVWLNKKLFSKAPDLAVDRVRAIKNQSLPDEVVPNVGEQPVINAFQWAKAKLAIGSPGALVEVQRLEADSKFFRSFVVVLLVLLVWTSFIAVQGRISWWIVLTCLLFLVLSLWRYIERRFKATQQAYWYVLTMEHCPLPSEEKESPSIRC